jgi:hypothetical protein
MDNYPSLKQRDLPKPPSWTKALGVGVVVMGLAIGTGELIMWPHLVTKHGLGLLWMALAGIGAQYFINQEVARHAVATGEGFFASSARVLKWSVFFWLFAAILLYVWPGWASALGTTLRELIGFGNHLLWAYAALVLVLILTFSGRVAYVVLERTLKIIVPAFFLLLIAISFGNLNAEILREALAGVINIGYIPDSVDLNVLLSAVVFAGAGGMLNLCVSLWYRDKQIGMGAYMSRITNPITGREVASPATGYAFKPTKENLARWKGWMKFVRVDQGVIFFLLGFTTLFLLAVNAYAVLTPKGIVPEGLDVAVVQAHIFGDHWGPAGYKLFLLMAFLMLFSVMWTVIDALTRMISSILYTNAHAGPYQRAFAWCKRINQSKLYYASIVIICAVGAILLPLKQPLTLLTISAVLGGLTMAIYTPLLIYMNNVKLPKEIRPSWITNLAMTAISAFFIYFAARIIDLHLIP